MKRLKTVRAGRLVVGVCYSQALPGESSKARAAKSKCSTLARRALNFRAAWQKLRLILCANFARGDLWITLSYDDDHLPATRREAKARMQLFIDKLRAARRRAGEELRYIYNIEEIMEDGSRRFHHHMIMNAGTARNDYELIRSLWTFGDNIEIRKLGEHEIYSDDFLELAKYMCKERDPEAKVYNVGDKCWIGSRNLERPKTESETVSDNVTITAPPGAIILDKHSEANEYGSFDYIVYLLPKSPPHSADPPRRRAKFKKAL